MGQSYKIGQDVIRFLETIIDSMRNTEVITNWTDNGDGTYTADTINTFDLEEGSAVLLDEAQFQDSNGDPEAVRVTAVTPDTDFTVKGSSLPTVTSYQEAKPFFFYGTPKTINKTMVAVDTDDLKFPAIALIKTFPEDVDINPRSLVGTMPTLELAFVTPSNFEDWDIKEIHDNAIRPMRQLAETFVDEVKRSPSIVHHALDGYAIEDRPDIGVYLVDQGNDTHIFAQRTSGVMLQITIPITKRFCKEAEGDDTLSIQSCAGVTIYESDGTTVDQVVPSGGRFTKPGTITPTGIAYQRIAISQVTSYRTGDTGWHVQNGTFDNAPPSNPETVQRLDYTAAQPFFTLRYNNAFSNKNRFTNDQGGSVYNGSDGSTADYAIDHLTGIGWYLVRTNGVNWNTAIDSAAASTAAGHNDWRLPTFLEWFSIVHDENAAYLNYSPFSNFASLPDTFWTGDTQVNDTSIATLFQTVTSGSGDDTRKSRAPKTGFNFDYVLCRNHY